jgi:phosphoserine phosphatase
MKNNDCRLYCYRKTRKNNIKNSIKMDYLELVVFDMDGVLTNIHSSWRYIHDYFNTSNNRSVDEYLKGKINDLEFIRRDASLWVENGLPIKNDRLVEILSKVPLMYGAKECINNLRDKNIKTAIISAGLNILANRVANDLCIDYVFSNGIKTDEKGRITGEGILNVKLMYKDQTIELLSKQTRIPLKRIATVGNSCFDIPMFEITGLSIAFNPSDECVKKAADIIVESKNLIETLPFFDFFYKYKQI